MKILAIESSCDETSAAVLINGEVKSNIISTQHFHSKYGGVVPELASRAHIQYISEIVNHALKTSSCKISDIDTLAVTSEPGLVGSLIVGSNYAKGLSLKYNLPIVPINHIEGHLYSGAIEDNSLTFPYISLVVSGGHTVLYYVRSYSKYEILGSTIDDAAGEAFDKIAKLLGLEYPGGPLIDKFAKSGNREKYRFPRPMIHEDNFNFSFSGLKTSARYFLHNNFPDGTTENELCDIAASVQEAIVDVLVEKSLKALRQRKADKLAVAGGVSANSRLREKLDEISSRGKYKTFLPKMNYCIDNAAMIGFLADKKISEMGKDSFQDLTYRVNPSALRFGKKSRK